MEITIVGAGTAGLVTALILKQKFNQNINLKIIKSEDIGIIGVGEGSTEHWMDFMNWCQLDFNEVIKSRRSVRVFFFCSRNSFTTTKNGGIKNITDSHSK